MLEDKNLLHKWQTSTLREKIEVQAFHSPNNSMGSLASNLVHCFESLKLLSPVSSLHEFPESLS